MCANAGRRWAWWAARAHCCGLGVRALDVPSLATAFAPCAAKTALAHPQALTRGTRTQPMVPQSFPFPFSFEMPFALSLPRTQPTALIAMKRSKPAQNEFFSEVSVNKVKMFHNLSSSWAVEFLKERGLVADISSRAFRTFAFTMLAHAMAMDPDSQMHSSMKRYRDDGISAALIDKIIAASPVDLDPEDNSASVDPIVFLQGLGVPEEIMFACEASIVNETAALQILIDLHARIVHKQVRLTRHNSPVTHPPMLCHTHSRCPAASRASTDDCLLPVCVFEQSAAAAAAESTAVVLYSAPTSTLLVPSSPGRTMTEVNHSPSRLSPSHLSRSRLSPSRLLPSHLSPSRLSPSHLSPHHTSAPSFSPHTSALSLQPSVFIPRFRPALSSGGRRGRRGERQEEDGSAVELHREDRQGALRDRQGALRDRQEDQLDGARMIILP